MKKILSTALIFLTALSVFAQSASTVGQAAPKEQKLFDTWDAYQKALSQKGKIKQVSNEQLQSAVAMLSGTVKDLRSFLISYESSIKEYYIDNNIKERTYGSALSPEEDYCWKDYGDELQSHMVEDYEQNDRFFSLASMWGRGLESNDFFESLGVGAGAILDIILVNPIRVCVYSIHDARAAYNNMYAKAENKQFKSFQEQVVFANKVIDKTAEYIKNPSCRELKDNEKAVVYERLNILQAGLNFIKAQTELMYARSNNLPVTMNYNKAELKKLLSGQDLSGTEVYNTRYSLGSWKNRLNQDLALAAERGDIKAAGAAIDNGADTNAKYLGETVLQHAKNQAMKYFLISRGAK